MGIISIQLVWVFFIPFSTHLETSPLLVKGCKFWHMLGTYGLWAVRVFSVLHLLWHWGSVYIGHLWGPVKHTLNADYLTMELSLPVLTTKVCPRWDLNTQHWACWVKALTHCATAAAYLIAVNFLLLAFTLLFHFLFINNISLQTPKLWSLFS